jgi:uncharacterized protein with HEPN domain
LKFRLQETELSINQITTALDVEHHLDGGSFLSIFKHLIARKEIVMDMLSTNISSCSSAKLIQVWTVHHCEIIGEAVNALPPELLTQFPEIPWGRITGLRNRLIHEYFWIDPEII